MKAGWSKAQAENKALKSDLEGMDIDIKRIQAERDRLILSHRDSHKCSHTSDLRTLQEQNRLLQEELQRLKLPDAEVQRLGSALQDRELQLQDWKLKYNTMVYEFSTAFKDLDSRFEALKASEQAAIQARDQALQSISPALK